MNKNIEIINPELWAVKFDISNKVDGIDFENNPPSRKEGGRISSEGILVLNKDYAGYEFLKRFMAGLINDTNEQLQLKKKIASTPGKQQFIPLNFINTEIQRRKTKGVWLKDKIEKEVNADE